MVLKYSISIWRFALGVFLAWAMVLFTLPAGGGRTAAESVPETAAWADKGAPSMTREYQPLPNLDGDKAKDYLEQQGLSDSLGEAIKRARYAVNWVDRAPVSSKSGAYEAKNPQQNFSAYFSDDGVNLFSREADEQWSVSLKLSKYGSVGEQWPTANGEKHWSADKTKVSVSHEIHSQITNQKTQIIEFFENKPEGLEHSFIIQQKIDTQAIKLVLSIQGDLLPEVSADGQALMFTNDGGETVLRYDRLKSWDSNGTELASRMEAYGSELSLVVDDENAVYPVTIDPTFTQVRKLVASDGAPNDLFGRSLALSGNTAIVGAISDDVGPNANQGSAYIFERNAGGADNWNEVKKLTASDGGVNDGFGGAVAIEGNTAIVSASEDVAAGQGSVYIFERNAGGANNWGEVKKLSPTVEIGFGASVSIDQSTLVVGAEGFFDGEMGVQGSAHIFERNLGGANNWGLVKRIEADDGDIGDFFGSASCIEGNTVFIGTGRSRAYVFERDAGGIDNWGQLKKLVSAQGDLDVAFAITLSVDGDTAVIGAPFDFENGNDDGQGAAYIFGRNAGGENNWGLIKRIIAADGAAFDSFGISVAVSGEIIVVTSHRDDVGANTDQGSAYVFERNSGGADNWGQVKKLVAADAAPSDRLGLAVALENKTILVGAPRVGPGTTGPDAAYVFVQTNDSWVQTAKPLPGNCTVEDSFGSAVAISGDTAIIGATGDDVGANANQGAAYIFERSGSTWNLVRTVSASDGVPGDSFGTSVALSGDTAIVGVFTDDTGANVNQGSAYIFERNSGGSNNWGQVKKLTASDGSAEDWFGWSVGISGDWIIVGAILDDVGGNGTQGSAYIYERNSGGANNWGEVKQLFASDGAAFDTFGKSVAVSGDTAVVGSDLDDVGANGNQGSVYIFERNLGGAGNWGELRKVVASDGATTDQFGEAVAIDGDTLIVGAFTDDVASNNNQGSAYIFERNTGGANNWGQVKKLVASDGAGADLFGNTVDVDGDVVIVGSVHDQVGSNDYQGSAYFFRQNTGGADNWGEERKIIAADGEAQDYFGIDVAISGETSIVGANYDDVGGGINQGSARIFVSGGGTWNQQALLGPAPETNCGTNDAYGTAVAISGDTAVIGAPSDEVGISTNQGSAYILERNAGGPDNWGVVKLLTASDGEANDFYGTSVAISDDKVIVGAANDTIGPNAIQGSAYIYERNNGGENNWNEIKKLVVADGSQEDRFGTSVSISNNRVIVGAIYEDNGSTDQQGAAYIFEQSAGGANNWGQIKKLVAPDGAAQDWFGNAVAISGDTVIVGAYFDDLSTLNEGSAYIFERNSGGNNAWGLAKKLTASDGANFDLFAYSVAISGNTVVVGAHVDDIGTNINQGSAYIFERNTGGADNWGESRKLLANDGAAEDFFGHSVSVSGDAVIVGAPYDDIAANVDQGSAYIFAQNTGGADNWGQVRKLVATDGAASDFFGYAVAVSGDNFLVGGYQANVPTPFGKQTNKNFIGGNQQGASYIFKGNALAPTAANVSISGRVANATGQGIGRVRVSLTDAQGNVRTALSSSFGYYMFDDVPAGQTYIISISHKKYTFNPNTRALNVFDTLENVNFTADE